MKSVFEVKNPLPFDADVFDTMKKRADELFSNREKKEYTQAIVLLSASGREYYALIENALSEDKNEEKALIERLSAENDTDISRVLCVWQDGGIDIPSFAFRKLLLDSDSSNGDCGLFVVTSDGYSVIGLKNTIK